MGMRQWEFLVRDQLTTGLQTIRDNSALVDEMFPDLSENSRDNIRDWLANHDLSILLGWPQNPEDFPCWVISLAGEGAARTPIGNLMTHTSDFSQDGSENDEMGDFVQKTYVLFTMSGNADLTVILGTILQHILKSIRRDQALDGFYDMRVAQKDRLDMRVDFLPDRIFVRSTTVSLLTEDTTVYIDTSLPKGVTVSLTVDIGA